jgi:hypothetical protein
VWQSRRPHSRECPDQDTFGFEDKKRGAIAAFFCLLIEPRNHHRAFTASFPAGVNTSTASVKVRASFG